jgi:hypothetical protein
MPLQCLRTLVANLGCHELDRCTLGFQCDRSEVAVASAPIAKTSHMLESSKEPSIAT